MEKEFKDSLNEMIDSKNLEEIKLANSIIKNQPDMVDSKDLKGHWYNINDYVTDQTVKYTELYYTDKKSDKVYILLINKTKNNSWGKFEVEAHYGRRGKTMQYDSKDFYNHIDSAEETFDRIIKEKLKKGYKIINED